MKVQVQELSPIEKSLSIEVEPAVIAKELEQAYQQLGRQVKIAGFRPGKVPRRILEQRFKSEVEDDVTRRVVSKSYLEAVRQHNIEAVADPHVTNPKLDPASPFAFTARVEVKPVVTAKDFKGLALKKLDSEVTEKTIDERVEMIRQNLTELETVKDRDVAKANDIAVVDFTATIDGKGFPGDKGTGVHLELSPGELVNGHLPALEGVKVGDTKEVDYAFPSDYRVEEVKGAVAKFLISVKELKQKVVPPVDDALAEKSGAGVHTLKELRERIKKDLDRAQKRQNENTEREELVKGLVEKNTFDVPRAMIERAMDMMFEGAINMMARSGMDPNQLNLDWAKLREEFRGKAETEVKAQLLFEAISKQEKIEVSDEDVEKKLEALAEESNSPLSQVRKAYKDGESKNALKSRIREEKTIAFLKSAATYS
ncbi:MAG: trigger factor [Myxococcaceae bacterium]|nr:trigger factor [Myxococcaceae bacterium]